MVSLFEYKYEEDIMLISGSKIERKIFFALLSIGV